MASSSGWFANDYSLTKCLLTLSNNNQIELRRIVQEINTYESLFTNHVTAEILVKDTSNMIGCSDPKNGPIFGFETILLSFQTPNQTLWSKTLRVVRIEGRELEKDRSQMYTIHLASPALLTGMQTRISKSYNGKLISDVASDILTNIIGTTASIEQTQTLHQIIIPNLTADHALNWLTTRALSAAYKGASYFYYEDRDQHQFRSVESLIAQALPISSMTPDMVYLYQPSGIRENNSTHSRNVAMDMRTMTEYKFHINYNILDNVSAGMYGNTVLIHDNVKKQWTKKTWDYPSTFGSYQHLSSNSLWSPTVADLNGPGSKFKIHSAGVYEYPVAPDAWLSPRISQLQQLHNICMSVVVPGCTNRYVGQVIALNLPSPQPPINNQQVMDYYYQGRYLIGAVRHKIDQSKMETILDLTSDSVFNPYP